MSSAAAHPPEPRYGWVVALAAAVCMAVANGSVLSISVFLKPLIAQFGWQRGDVALAYTLGSVSMGVGGVVLGWLSDRAPTRLVVLIGTVALAAALLLLSRITALWQLYALYCLLGGVGGAACFAPLIAVVGGWFERRKGVAIGIVTAGQSLGYATVPLLARAMISLLGWRETYASLGVLALGVLLPLVLLLREPEARSPAGSPPAATGAGRGALSPTAAVAWISAVAITSGVFIGTALVHVVPLAQDAGLAPELAASVLSVMTVAGIVGRLTFGRVGDAIGGVRAYLISTLLATALIGGFVQLSSLPGFYALAVPYGFAYAGTMTSMMVCVREMTPPQRRGLATAVVALFGWAGLGLGGWQGGVVFDLTGSYRLPFLNATLAGVVSVAVLTVLWRLSARRARPAPA